MAFPIFFLVLQYFRDNSDTFAGTSLFTPNPTEPLNITASEFPEEDAYCMPSLILLIWLFLAKPNLQEDGGLLEKITEDFGGIGIEDPDNLRKNVF